MSFLNTHRLHWGSHPKLSGNLHEHLDLLIHQEPDKNTQEADHAAPAAIEIPTEMPSQIVGAPPSRQELGQ
ncbi:MAG TPA: hypothetical protein VL357_09585 [Rariglobus sp.]|nr:hypothetical protein [Rariglobus sp.]